MQLITVMIGYYFASLGTITSWKTVLLLLLGTYLTAAGAGTLNHYMEREIDAKMDRTKTRPLPTGQVKPNTAALLGICLVISGLAILYIYTNLLTTIISFLTVFLYIAIYTPLKQKTWLNTFVGAFPGATPILGGWAAATGTLHPEAWILFLILFTWQHPHFYALAIMYKDDYEKGGLKMLPVVESPSLDRTIRQTILYTLLMIASSIIPTFLGITGNIYLLGMLAAGAFMLKSALKLAKTKTKPDAKKLFFASIIYLPLWLILIIVDIKIP